MQRLGKNHDGYYGERIDVDALLSGCREAAERHGWTVEAMEPPPLNRWALTRVTGRPDAPRIYLSAGMHGDEPAGPLALLQLLQENRWPEADLWVIPCLNPEGLRVNSRTNRTGVDVNRDYRNSRSQEALGHITWLTSQPRFDLTLLLHEDWEAHGFYCYEVNPTNLPSLAPGMVAAVSAVCPIDSSPLIDGRPLDEPGIIRPVVVPEERPDWPEALWLRVHKTPLSYTLEAPSDWPLEIRIKALVTAVRSSLEAAYVTNGVASNR